LKSLEGNFDIDIRRNRNSGALTIKNRNSEIDMEFLKFNSNLVIGPISGMVISDVLTLEPLISAPAAGANYSTEKEGSVIK